MLLLRHRPCLEPMGDTVRTMNSFPSLPVPAFPFAGRFRETASSVGSGAVRLLFRLRWTVEPCRARGVSGETEILPTSGFVEAACGKATGRAFQNPERPRARGSLPECGPAVDRGFPDRRGAFFVPP